MSPLRSLAALLLTATTAFAVGPAPEAAAPPPPPKYDVVVRYDIDAFRNERLVQWREMLAYFDRFGLQKGEGPEDEAENRTVTRLNGTIASEHARKLLLERHVRAVLLRPAGAELAKDETPVRVQIELAGVLPPEPGRFVYALDTVRRLETENGSALARQRLLADQARPALAKLGFREAAGYDTRGHTRLVGTVPANRLDALLDDLRRQTPDAPAPFATRWPILAVEVQSALPTPAIPATPAAAAKGQENVAPDLRARLAGGAADTPERLDVVLWAAPQEADTGWQNDLSRAVPGLVVEGRLGPVVSVLAPASAAPTLAALPQVANVRLPRSATSRPFGVLGEKVDDRALASLAEAGRRGKGVTIAILDGDFRGWQAALGQGARLLDLTASRNATLQGDPYPGDATALGHGTQLALAARKAAPQADLVLVRLDPAAPYMMQVAAHGLSGEPLRSINLDRRASELETERDRLGRRSVDLAAQRRAAFEARGEADEIEKLLNDYRAAQKQFDQDQRDFEARLGRWLTLEEGLRGLRKVKTIVNGLAWNEGIPTDGSGALARSLADRPGKPAPWLAVPRDVRGQVWSGLFRDNGGDGLGLFRPSDVPLPKGMWSPNVAFLGWRGGDGKAGLALPAGARVRVAVQWREAHDPEFFRRGEDLYREPLTPLHVAVLRQFDPTGATRPADDFAVVAQTSGLPVRIDNQANAATYEQSVEFVVKEAGSFALQLRGRHPAGTRPAGAPTLPAQKESWELRPRLFVETLDGAGTAVYRDFATMGER